MAQSEHATPIPWDTIALAILLACVAAGTWEWQHQVRASRKAPALTEPWKHVREQFPLPAADDEMMVAPELKLEAMVKANPFSAKRREEPPKPAAGGAQGGKAEVKAPPKFVYKGRVTMGANQRAVVEDLTTKKTHFLQVGQEVAGFRVLDIGETQVVLSSPTSPEPLTLSLTPKTAKGE